MTKIKKNNEPTNGFVIIPDNILFNPSLSTYAKVVYSALKKFCFNKNTCFPSTNTLKDKLKISRNVVNRAIKELTGAGIITIAKHKGIVNHYTLTCTPGVQPLVPDKYNPCTPGVQPLVPDKYSNNNNLNNKKEKEEINKDAEKNSAPSEHSLLRQIFQDFYYTTFNRHYNWGKLDGVHLKKIIGNLKKEPGGGDLGANFQALLQAAIQDKWRKDHFSLAKISSQYNEITAQGIRGNEYGKLKEDFGIQ